MRMSAESMAANQQQNDKDGQFTMAIKSLRTSAPKKVYNTLVDIRTRLLKAAHGTERLTQYGCVEELLRLLQSNLKCQSSAADSASQCLDLILSILGNMCMTRNARQKMYKHNGVYLLVRILQETQSESLHNRACRTLANLANDPKCYEVIHKTPALHIVIKLLKDCENKECQMTYSRALRLFCPSKPECRTLVEADGVSCLAKLLMRAEDEEVLCSVTRALADVSAQPTADFTQQLLLGSGVADKLVTLVDSSNKSTAQYSCQTLMHIAEQENARPLLGNAGLIKCFTDLLNDSKQTTCAHIKLFNILCLFSQEVVNRVKLRDFEFLPSMVSALKNPAYSMLHNRIISALISFIYDEPSLEILVSGGLVPLLCEHLTANAGFDVRKMIDYSFDTGLGSEESDIKIEHVVSLSPPAKRRKLNEHVSNRESEEKLDTAEILLSKDPLGLSVPDQEYTEYRTPLYVSSPIPSRRSSTNVPRNNSNLTESECNDHSSTKVDSAGAKSKYRFSMDSPSYITNYTRRMEEDLEDAVLCKTHFQEGTHAGMTSPLHQYSPLSDTSYYSPGKLSPYYQYLVPSPASPAWSIDSSNSGMSGQSPNRGGEFMSEIPHYSSEESVEEDDDEGEDTLATCNEDEMRVDADDDIAADSEVVIDQEAVHSDDDLELNEEDDAKNNTSCKRI